MKLDFLEEHRILFLETKYVSGQPSVTEEEVALHAAVLM